MILPGWNSLDSVTRIGNAIQIGTLCCWGCLVLFEAVAHFWKKGTQFFTALALFAFGLAVVGEVGNYKYGGRKDQLHEDSEKALKQNADDANNRATELEASLADRHLTLGQRKQMLAILRGLPRTRVMVTYLLNADSDAQEYATDIGSVFRDMHGWTLVPPPPGVSSDQPVYGFAIQAQNDSISKIQRIENALTVTGYKVTRWPAKQGQEEIDIYVGRRNPPKQHRDISNR